MIQKEKYLSNKAKVIAFLALGLLLLNGSGYIIASPQQAVRAFTVADEIGVAHFGEPYGWQADNVRFSPDGNYFAVDIERGRLDLNRVEDSLKFYRSQDIKHFLEHPSSQPPSPVWIVTRS